MDVVMSTIISTTSLATSDSSSSVGDSAQPNTLKAPSCRFGSPNSIVPTTKANTTSHQRLSTPPAIASSTPTTPSSRPPTPPIAVVTPSNTPSAHVVPSNRPLARSNGLNRLSHISIATWAGVGFALASVIITVYYGILIMRLATWTAKNDFRETCKSELVTALPQTAACNKALSQSPLPPLVRKRMVSIVQEYRVWKSWPLRIAGLCAVLLLIWRALKYLQRCNLKTASATIEKEDCSMPPPYRRPLNKVTAMLQDAIFVYKELQAKASNGIASYILAGRVCKLLIRNRIITAAISLLLAPLIPVLYRVPLNGQISPRETIEISLILYALAVQAFL